MFHYSVFLKHELYFNVVHQEIKNFRNAKGHSMVLFDGVQDQRWVRLYLSKAFTAKMYRCNGLQ